MERRQGATIDYCVVNELPALLWAVNLGSIELHTSLHALQVYVPLNNLNASYRTTKPVARGIAELLESQTPDRVVSRMARALRPGRLDEHGDLFAEVLTLGQEPGVQLAPQV
jgi:bifunctional non-homologous end joining protein LigD